LLNRSSSATSYTGEAIASFASPLLLQAGRLGLERPASATGRG
jgi:hypothetical protein